MKFLPPPLAAVLLFTSCGTPTVTAPDNPATPQSEAGVYSIYFDDGDWLLKDRLGMMVVADHLKGPEHNFGRDLITVYFYNITKAPILVRIVKVESLAAGGEQIVPAPEAIPVSTDKKAGREVGHFKVPHKAVTIPMKITVNVEGKLITKELTLHRRTKAELENNFKPGAAAPYPWLNPWNPSR